MPWIYRERAPAAQAPFHWFSHSVPLWVEQATASVEPRYLFPFLLIILLHTFQEATSALRVLNMLNRYINSLGKNPALNLFVYNNAHRMLGDTVRSSSFALEHLWGIPFWWCLQYHLSSRFACLWPKGQLHVLAFPAKKLIFSFFFLKDFIYLFLEGGERREKERERNISVRLRLMCPIPGNLASNPGMCPDWESTQWPFGSQPTLNPLTYTSQGYFFFFFIYC